MSLPVLTIVAGPNGSGKTSLTSLARTGFQQVAILDPDAIARSLREASANSTSDIQACKKILQDVEDLVHARQSFIVETTLSGSTYLKLALRAKKAGFRIVAFLVGTSSVEINVERVRARVKKGGHDVPEEDQWRRYPRSLANMERLLPLTDYVFIYDNSSCGWVHPDIEVD